MNKLKDILLNEDRDIAKHLLTRARAMLNPDEGEFVCCNLTSAAESWDEKRVVRILREEITRRLDGYTTVCGWLRESVGIKLEDVFAEKGWRLVEYRRRWIDSMLKELE